MQEDVRLQPLHQFHIVLGELEGRLLEIEPAWRVGDHETEVDVHNMPHIVHQYIVIVPVLDLEQVLEQRVAGQAVGEVGDGSLPVLPVDLLIDGAK